MPLLTSCSVPRHPHTPPLPPQPGSVSGFKSGALYRPRPKDVQALSELTRLQSLVIRCDQEPPAASELASLSKLVKLTSLDLGTWTVGKANLQAITHLTSLRVRCCALALSA